MQEDISLSEANPKDSPEIKVYFCMRLSIAFCRLQKGRSKRVVAKGSGISYNHFANEISELHATLIMLTKKIVMGY